MANGSSSWADHPWSSETAALDHWLVDGGDMGELIRSMDWSNTPLGPLEAWPHSLRTTVGLCLASNFPINIIWGPSYNQIYNDGYRVIVADRHPAGMGMAYDECWASAWDAIGPPFEHAWEGDTSFIENRRMFLTRNGYLEETFFTFSLSPIRDERGKIAGLFHPVTETTAQMLSERRTRALRELAANTSGARTLGAALAGCIQTLGAHSLDLPFILLYRMTDDGSQARLTDVSGIAPGLPVSPRIMRSDDAGPWSLTAILNNESFVEASELRARFGAFDCGPYPEGAQLALACALRVAGVSAPVGIFIAGISPRLPFAHEYCQHVEQVAAAVATTLGNALAYEREKKRAEELAELDRAKTQFFSNISHEFRTPLTLILGPLENTLELAGSLPDEVQQQLTVAHRNSLRLLRLVNALLDFSRLEAGRVKAFFQPADLASLTAELASNFRSAVERAGLYLHVHCPPLPEPVYVDTEMWEKIVLNLLSNAFKFTFEGGITVDLKATEGGIELAVSDTGTGIEEKELPHLFERFHRVGGARGRTHEGTGIGLALVEEMVRLHAGDITVDSKPGQGSVFRVRVPRGAAHLPASQIGDSSDLAHTAVRADAFVEEALRWSPDEDVSLPSLTLNGERGLAIAGDPRNGEHTTREIAKVLVVDDNADMRDYVRRLLMRQYDVATAVNGEQALALALGEPPGIILADITMPGIDGFALLGALRSHPRTRTVPVILLSARAGEDARSEGIEAGADDYLVKPFVARKLLARVSAHLTIARVRKDAERRLKRVFETEAVGVLFSDRRGTVIDANDVFLRMTGYSRADIEQGELTRKRMTPPEWVDASEEQMRCLAATGRLGPYEKEFFLADGSRRWMLLAGRDLGDGTTSEFCIDVTDRRRTEEALRESEERFRALVNATSDAVFRMSPDWTEMRELGGAGFADTRNPTRDWIQTYIPREAQAEVLDAVRDAVARRRIFELEHRVWRADGTMGWTHSRALPLVNTNGAVVEWFGTASDVTARRETEDALRSSLAERGALLNELHHSVKNNLQVITSLLEMQAGQVGGTHAFALFHEARNRVASIASIHELLYRSGAFSREVELAAYARELVQHLVVFYRAEHRIAFAVEGDGVHLELERAVPYGLLLNELISNVCKHAFSDGTAGRLTIKLAQHGPMIKLQVVDTGMGLPEGFSYRDLNTLGVQLVHTLADQLGGSATFSSTAEGTCVEVNLPREVKRPN